MSNESIIDTFIKKNALTRVLVIDDNPDILEIVSRTLDGSEFQVIGASNGRQGIQMAKEHKPDIILLDITMPVFDGFMTGKVIKRNQDTKDIPIIFLSGRKTKQDITAAIQAGGSDYIVKPFTPNDLLTRMRRVLQMQKVEQKRTELKNTGFSRTSSGDSSESIVIDQDTQSFVRYGDIIVCPSLTPALTINNYHIYRGIFTNLVSDNFVKIVFDVSSLEKIDGSGLALLVSVNEALKSSSGSLKIILSEHGQLKQLLYAKVTDIFDCYNTVQMAVESYAKQDSMRANSEESETQDVCMVCANMNDTDSRYCKYCGSNLVVSRGIKILDVVRRVISRAKMEEMTGDFHTARTQKDSIMDENIPSEFVIELTDGPLILHYNASLLEKENYISHKEIGIRAPFIRNSMIPLLPGMPITMRNNQVGSGIFDTVITSVDGKNGIMHVRYTEEAKVLHSQKNFSVAPKLPITLQITCPAFNYTGGIIKAQILELNRLRMVVFSDKSIPEKECLSISFNLPDEFEISSPLAIAIKRKERFMYDIEFAVIDEREQTKLVQYMYKRQIELARGVET